MYGKQTLNSTCSTNSSGILNLTGLEIGVNHYALFTANISGEETPIASGWVDLPEDSGLGSGRYGYFLALGIFLTFFFMAWVHYFAIILATLSLFLMKLLGIINLDWGFLAVLFIASILLASLIQRRGR